MKHARFQGRGAEGRREEFAIDVSSGATPEMLRQALSEFMEVPDRGPDSEGMYGWADWQVWIVERARGFCWFCAGDADLLLVTDVVGGGRITRLYMCWAEGDPSEWSAAKWQGVVQNKAQGWALLN